MKFIREIVEGIFGSIPKHKGDIPYYIGWALFITVCGVIVAWCRL